MVVCTESLKKTRVALIGAGMWGSKVALGIAKAGIGQITVFDRDRVSISGLDSGIFSIEGAEINRPKVDALRDRILSLTPNCNLFSIHDEVTYANALEVLSNHDLIIDTTRSHELKQVLNEVAFTYKVPLILADQLESYKWIVLSIVPGSKGGCYRCLFPKFRTPEVTALIDDIETSSLVNCLPLGAMEWVIGVSFDSLAFSPGAWIVDTKLGMVTVLDITSARRTDCELCINNKMHYLKGNDVTYSANLCEKQLIQIGARDGLSLDFNLLVKRIGRKARNIKINSFMLTCQCNDLTISLFKNGRANIKGTKDMLKARGCYFDLLGV